MTDVEARGLRFNVTRMGRGDHVIVFVHGFIIDNLASFYLTLVPVLQAEYSLVLYDLRGHGRSQQTASGYSIDEGVEDLAALLDAIGVDKRPITLVANSGGAVLALSFALRFPQRLEGLVLIDGHTGLPSFGEDLAQTVGAIGGSGPTRSTKEMWENWVSRHNDEGELNRDGREMLEVIERFKQRQRSPLLEGAQSLVHQTSLIEDLRRTPGISEQELASIQCPVLAVYGAESELRPEALRLQRCVPSCELHLIEDCAHSVLRGARVELATHLKAWLTSTLA